MTGRAKGSLALCAAMLATLLSASSAAAAEEADEIHYSYGDTPDSVVVDWRGQQASISYGLTDAYGQTALARPPAIAPVDSAGPFREARLTGLAAGTTYHYRIGETGPDRTLRTVPAGGFSWVDVGDTASTLCKPWVAGIHRLIASVHPDLVTHGGDISDANACGSAGVHTYYVDQQVWSTAAAFQPVWGNHEYGTPTSAAPRGTPRDSLANYKGRGYVTHSQTISYDSYTQRAAPGCSGLLPGNNCRGEDWGWFRVSAVLFISYPEDFRYSMADWQAAAGTLMAQAQADPSVDFIVTYGHRPAYSSQSVDGWVPAVRTALDALAARYSPRPDNPGGKYVLNLSHHVHALEVFRPINGLTHITNGTGGQGQVGLDDPDPNSMLRLRHPGVLSNAFNAATHQLTLSWVCGPVYSPAPKDPCRLGETIFTTTFTPGRPPQMTQWVGNPGVETDLSGWTGLYGPSPHVTVTRSTTGGAHSGVAAIKVQARAGASDLASGFSDSPRWMPSAPQGTPFTASIFVRPGSLGQAIVLRVREWTPARALVADRYATMTATSRRWQQLAVQLTIAHSGDSLTFIVYARHLDAGESFLADDASLISA